MGLNLWCLTPSFNFRPFPWGWGIMNSILYRSRGQSQTFLGWRAKASTEAEPKESGHQHHKLDTELRAESPLLLKGRASKAEVGAKSVHSHPSILGVHTGPVSSRKELNLVSWYITVFIDLALCFLKTYTSTLIPDLQESPFI